MHSETLRGCGIAVETVLLEEKGYFLARALRGEKRLVVEITPLGSGYVHSWPASVSLAQPVEARNLPGELRLLVFDTGRARFLLEDLRERPFNPGEAAAVAAKTAEVMAGLQASGLIMGYTGPENLLRDSGGGVTVLAGRRGVPSMPFTPPEAVGRRPSDPRSDVFALGTLYLRLLAGSDEREPLVATGNRLSDREARHLSSMLEQNPMNRPSGVIQAASELAPEGAAAPSQAPVSGDGFRREAPSVRPVVRPGRRKKRKTPLLWIAGGAAVLLAGLLILKPWKKNPDSRNGPPATDFQTVAPRDTVVEEPPDTISLPDTQPPDTQQDTAVIWISNGTGTEDAENAFRAGPARAFSYVYPARCTTRRRTSLVLVRREEPGVPLSMSALYPAARGFSSADTSMKVSPTDLTILLGTDLYHPGINPGNLSTPDGPGDTLYIDIANHGIQYTLEGMGAASWMASKLDGREVTIQGRDWILKVSDIRDGDRLSEEIGIPAALETTTFLYRPGSAVCGELEGIVRSVFQALPAQVQGPPQGVPVPDVHVLMGAP